MRKLILLSVFCLTLLSALTANGQWCQQISADFLAPGVNVGVTQNDGSHWVAGLYRGFLEIPGPAGPVHFTSPTSGDPSEYRYTGYLARYMPDGSLAWAKEIRSNFNRLLVHRLVAVPDGSVIITGNYNGPIVFNLGESDQFVLQGTTDALFMARFQPDGSLMWAKALPGGTMTFPQFSFAHWHNNELYIGVLLNNGDIDFDPGPGTTRIFAPFLQPNQLNYCFGRYTASGDLIQAGYLARGIALGVGQPSSIGQKIALPLSFSDSVQLFMGQTTVMQILSSTGPNGATVLTPDFSSVSGTYLTNAAELGVASTGYMVDLAVVNNQVRQIVGIGMGKLQINPNNPNDTIVPLPGSTYTQYEVIIDSQANYMSHQLISAFLGNTAAVRYAEGDADSLLVMFGSQGIVVNGTTYYTTRNNEQMAAVLIRNGNGFQLTKTARAIMNGVPLVSAGGGHAYFQTRWQDSLYFNDNLHFTAPLSRQFIEVCYLNDNGVSLGTNDLTASRQLVHLFPNPANSHIQLKLQSEAPTNIQLLDLQGRTVFQQQLHGTTESNIDVQDLPAGLYFCRWESAGEQGHIKWVKQ